MSGDSNEGGGRSYYINTVGAGARVAQGDNISWLEAVSTLPDGPTLAGQFTQIIDSIGTDPDLDDDSKELARVKVNAIAQALSVVDNNPGSLRLALKDGMPFFSSAASRIGKAIGSLLSGDAAQRTLSTVTDTATRAAISYFIS